MHQESPGGCSGAVALLVPEGLEGCALGLLRLEKLEPEPEPELAMTTASLISALGDATESIVQEGPAEERLELLPPPACPAGFKLGEAGSLSTVLFHLSPASATASRTLPAAALASASVHSAGVAAAMAVVALVEVDARATTPHEMLRSSAVITAARMRAALQVLLGHHATAAAAAPATITQSASSLPLLPFSHPEKLGQLRFRVATVRGGRHSKALASPVFSSAVADEIASCAVTEVASATAAAGWSWGSWGVSMKNPGERLTYSALLCIE